MCCCHFSTAQFWCWNKEHVLSRHRIINILCWNRTDMHLCVIQLWEKERKKKKKKEKREKERKKERQRGFGVTLNVASPAEGVGPAGGRWWRTACCVCTSGDREKTTRPSEERRTKISLKHQSTFDRFPSDNPLLTCTLINVSTCDLFDFFYLN